MQFEYTHPQTELETALGGFFHINAFGKIEAGDDQKFRSFIEQAGPPPRTTVYINSIGGDVEAAIGIGRLIREAWFHTSIGSYVLSPEEASEFVIPRKIVEGQCMSAATLVFLGGRLRYFSAGAKLGVHQFSFRNPSPEDVSRSQILSAAIAHYVSDMGIPAEFLKVSSSVSSSEIVLLKEADLSALNIITSGMTEVVWTAHAVSNLIYVRGERDSMFGHHKILFGYTRGSGFVIFALIESMGREEELSKFPVVEIALDHEADFIDISHRCHREVQGIYTVLHALLSDGEAKRIASATSVGVYVRMTKDAPIFLGASPMETETGKDQLQTIYNTFRAE